MSFGNLHLHIRGASRSEADRPEARRPEARGHEGTRSSARGSAASVTPQKSAVNESSAAFRSKSQTDLSVVTAEGDQITISLAAQVRYAASSQTGPGGSSQTVETAAFSQLRVAVEGDLSEAELKDLGTLLTHLADANRQAASGEASNPSAAAPADFSELTSLGAYSYRYQQTLEARALVNVRG